MSAKLKAANGLKHSAGKPVWPPHIEALKFLKTLPVCAAILDATGTIVAVNETWRQFARANGLCLPNEGVGANYLEYCADQQFRNDLQAALSGRLDLLTLVYPCHSPSQKRWFSLIGVPLLPGKPGGVALLHVDLTIMFPPQMEAGSSRAGTAGESQLQPAPDLGPISGVIEQSISETLSSHLNNIFASARDEDGQLPIRLSERQIQVLRLLGEGKTNREIAEALFRSPNTIKLHVSAILKQLRLKSRTQAALLASQLPSERFVTQSVGGVPKNTPVPQAQRPSRH